MGSYRQLIPRLFGDWLSLDSGYSDQGVNTEAVFSLSTWEDIPTDLSDWLQSQDGLKIDGSPLSTRQQLEEAFRFFQCQEKDLPLGSIDASPVAHVAVIVAVTYIRKIIKTPKPTICDLVIPGKCGEIIHRKCSSCGQRVFDDIFPLFALENPSVYVVRTRENTGCGLPGCAGRVSLCPLDKRQKYIAANRSKLERIPNTGNHGKWSSALCRNNSQCRGLPDTLLVKCTKCGAQKDHNPRWTIESPPRYVTARMRCQCVNDKCTDWVPVSFNIGYVKASSLCHLWIGMKKLGCDLSEFQDFPDIIFANKKLKVKAMELKVAKARAERMKKKA